MKNYLNESLSVQERAEALVNEMTVEEAASQLRYDAPAVERLGIPAYNWWNEGIHGLARSGVATMFPQAIAPAVRSRRPRQRRDRQVLHRHGIPCRGLRARRPGRGGGDPPPRGISEPMDGDTAPCAAHRRRIQVAPHR